MTVQVTDKWGLSGIGTENTGTSDTGADGMASTFHFSNTPGDGVEEPSKDVSKGYHFWALHIAAHSPSFCLQGVVFSFSCRKRAGQQRRGAPSLTEAL